MHVQITPELYWQEGDYSSNILVDGNLFDSYYGGITMGFIDDSYMPGVFQNHYNVTISNNIIRVRRPINLSSLSSLRSWRHFMVISMHGSDGTTKSG
jgi:hypothetical protein